jgi:hypothetical protein
MADKNPRTHRYRYRQEAVLPVRSGTVGPSVVDIAPLAKEFGAFTFDPVMVQPPRSKARSPTSMATRAY